jgi:glutathione S-transferase
METKLQQRVVENLLDQVETLKADAQMQGKVTFYGNPICPFAHRAWMAIVEKGVDHDFVLIPLSGELNKMKETGVEACPQWARGGKTLEEIQKIKDDYKTNVNSTGEVPTLGFNGQYIAEADVVSEFIHDAFPHKGPPLLPNDAFLRARTRHYLKILSGSSGVAALYGLLKNQDPTLDDKKIENVYKGLETFCKMASADGPFFLGEQISFADIMLAPFYDRFRFTLPAYRGVDLVPTDHEAHPWAARMSVWAKAIEATPSFQTTGSPKEVYVTGYCGYAGDRGPSTPGA